MEFSFEAALAEIGRVGMVDIANGARPPAEYFFAQFLPERLMPVYHVENAAMVVRATMAGIVGMDSPYAGGGAMEMSSFMEETAKLGNEVALSEKAIRTIQMLLYTLRGAGTSDTNALVNEALNFYNLIIIQPHLDAMEYLRGQVLWRGRIDWVYNQKDLFVDYQIPASQFLPTRTVALGTAYHLPGSVFWQDVRLLRRRLRNNVRVIIAHSETVDAIRYNIANQMGVIAETPGSTITFRRYLRNSENVSLPGQFSPESSDVVTVVMYDREGEILNPVDPSTTIKIPFMPRGKLLAIGNNTATGYIPGQGSQETRPEDGNVLGYTHIAPCVENGGRPGRWGELYIPQHKPWALHGRAVTNGLPVVNAGAEFKLAVATTEMPPPD